MNKEQIYDVVCDYQTKMWKWGAKNEPEFFNEDALIPRSTDDDGHLHIFEDEDGDAFDAAIGYFVADMVDDYDPDFNRANLSRDDYDVIRRVYNAYKRTV